MGQGQRAGRQGRRQERGPGGPEGGPENALGRSQAWREEPSGRRRARGRRGAYHEDGLVPQVGLLHRALGQRGHRAPPRQQGQQRRGAGGRLELRQRLAPGPAVELGREQQPRHRGLHVLLRVLVRVEGLPQLRGHVLCGARQGTAGQGPASAGKTALGTGTGGRGTCAEARRARVQEAPGGGRGSGRKGPRQPGARRWESKGPAVGRGGQLWDPRGGCHLQGLVGTWVVLEALKEQTQGQDGLMDLPGWPASRGSRRGHSQGTIG